jgi:hypothetical protein
MKKENKKILAINKPIQELSEFEVDEIIEELVKNGILEKDDIGHLYNPNDYHRGILGINFKQY